MLNGVPGTLVKEANNNNIELKFEQSTPRKFKKCHFQFKFFFILILNQCSGSPVSITQKKVI
jgi:hypothetical protein